MSLKKNIFFNGLLTISNLVIPLLVFPYISRVLGVENLGKFSFIDEVVNYFILFSTLGIATVGPREIAKVRNNSNDLSKVFSSIFRLHLIATIFVFFVFLISLNFSPKLSENYKVFLIGGAKIIANLFLVEWLFIGLENFKFVAIRGIAVKCAFVICVFCFINKKEDYDLYFYLTVGSFILNAFVNWYYALKLIKIDFKHNYLPNHLRAFLRFGAYRLLTSFYTTFNIVFLGFVSTAKEVGFYSTSVKIQSILLSLFTSYAAVLMPHSTSLIVNNRNVEFKKLINKSFNILFAYCLPIVFFMYPLAPQIIYIFSGAGYEGAVPVIRIVLFLIPIIGLELIFLNQILLPLNMDKEILLNAVIGASVGLLMNLIIVKYLGSVGSAFAWLLSETAVFIALFYFSKKKVKINIPFKDFSKLIITSIPYFLIGYVTKMLIIDNIHILLISMCVAVVYFLLLEFFFMKELSFHTLIKKIE